MDTQTAVPVDPACAGFKKGVDATVTALGCSPAAMVAETVTGKRTATLAFDGIDDLVTWAAWLHWPWASTSRDGQHIARAYGQWLGYACTLEAAEPLVPVATEL